MDNTTFVHVRCEAPAGVECQWRGQVRTVQLQYLGQGLYLRGEIVCECGFVPLTVDPEADQVQVQSLTVPFSEDTTVIVSS